MASPQTPALSLEERHHFFMRRLHSLTGIVPVGVFLIEHLFTNSRALDVFGGGREAFNKDVHWIHDLPYLIFIETLFIFLPLAYHSLYGVYIALTAHHNPRIYSYGANWRYTWQRITGWLALIFIVVHLLKFRFAHWIGWNAGWPVGQEMFVGAADPFELTRIGLNEWQPFGIAIPAAATFAFYFIGLAASVFHFANGIWTFCITWGITVGAAAQRKMGYVAATVGIVLMLWGSASLYAFWAAKPAATPSGTPVKAATLQGDH